MVNTIPEIAPMSKLEALEMSMVLLKGPQVPKEKVRKIEPLNSRTRFGEKILPKNNKLPSSTPKAGLRTLVAQPTRTQLQAAKILGYTPAQLRTAMASKGGNRHTYVSVHGAIVFLPQTLTGLEKRVTQAATKRRQQVTTTVEAAAKIRRQRKQKAKKPFKAIRKKQKIRLK